MSSRFDEKCPVNFLNKSRGIVGEEHYSEECKPIEITGTYVIQSVRYCNCWKVKVFYRKCKCKRYDNHEAIPFPIDDLPHEGVDIHDGPQCSYSIIKHSEKCYKFHLNCFCSRNGKEKKSFKRVDGN